MMKTFAVLLRGINVSGQKKIKMAELRNSLEQNGLQGVQTYIQSGNIVCQLQDSSAVSLETLVHSTILKDFGFDVPTLALSKEKVGQILNGNPYNLEDEKCQYFVLLKSPPAPELVDAFNQLHFENEDFHITESCVYLCCKTGYGKAKLSNNLIERKLKVEATARNLRTMRKLMEMLNA